MDKVTVRVASPFKIADTIFMPGEYEVDPEIASCMAAVGVLAPEGGEAPQIEAQADDAGSRLAEVEAERDLLLGQVKDLQGQIETLQKAPAPTGGADAADARPPKKGTASPKG